VDEQPVARDLQGFHLLLAGGGSGGHVFPGLAVAELVRQQGGEVSFVGSPGGMEARLVPARGVPFHPLPARPLVGQGPVRRLGALLTLGASCLRARRLVARLAPDVVLGTGGYVSAPAVLGARLARRPVVLLEPNAYPGAANRWLSRWAKGACVAFPEAATALRCPVWQTGVPVRQELLAAASEPPAGPPRLLVLGGSQGARQLNLLVPAALAALGTRLPPGLVAVHQCGEAHLQSTRADYLRRQLPGVAVEVVPFIEGVAEALAARHLVICRAGAITLAELAAVGRGAILVPLALAEAHQRRNAEALAAAGAARVLEGDAADAGGLAALLEELLADSDALREMARAARALARPAAAADILDHLLEVAA
jgi:UDP-N-acetylglucosamine--N-acetylmuramyl-(pentapeptide) pyrophosphoryl-undecaprenol N-acetylglucosamine transferase